LSDRPATLTERRRLRDTTVLPLKPAKELRSMSAPSFENIPRPSIRRRPVAIYYRERANFWREKVATTPEADPQRALYLEVAKSYERLAASYEQRA
jgi:hypothetical protein